MRSSRQVSSSQARNASGDCRRRRVAARASGWRPSGRRARPRGGSRGRRSRRRGATARPRGRSGSRSTPPGPVRWSPSRCRHGTRARADGRASHSSQASSSRVIPGIAGGYPQVSIDPADAEYEPPHAEDYPGRVNEVVVTAIGADRPGIVAAISAALLDIGGNLEDARAALLRGSFAITLAVAVPEGVEPEAVAARLAPVADELGLGISVQKAAPKGAEPTARRCMVSIYGADRPGIVATAWPPRWPRTGCQHPRPQRPPGGRPADLRAGHGGRDPRRARSRPRSAAALRQVAADPRGSRCPRDRGVRGSR